MKIDGKPVKVTQKMDDVLDVTPLGKSVTEQFNKEVDPKEIEELELPDTSDQNDELEFKNPIESAEHKERETQLAYLLLKVNLGKQKDLMLEHEKAVNYLEKGRPDKAVNALMGRD